MSGNPISIIVVNWNGSAHLQACFGALAAQTRRDFDLVVVDTGSSDDSMQWLKDQSLLEARLVSLKENRGFSGGNAGGYAMLTKETEFVVLLNNDTAPEPNWLAALVQAARADSAFNSPMRASV